MSRSQLTRQDIIRLLPVNDLLYTRTAPTNPVVERTQKKSFADGGGGARFGPNSHCITDLQTGTDFIDPLQSFLVFDMATADASAASVDLVTTGSACNIIRDSQTATRSGKEMDRMALSNWLNYHNVQMRDRNVQEHNLNGLMGAVPTGVAAAALSRGVWPTGVAANDLGATQRVMIPLKYISPIFDSDKLMPPHLARGLRVDLTLEAADIAFVLAGETGFDYEISKVSILTDNYRMADSVLEFLNAEFASKETGLVYEYTSYHTTKATTATDALDIEVRRSVSMALDAFCVTKLTANKLPGLDSFASYPVEADDTTQWRIGTHYIPNKPSVGTVEHYAQCLYWGSKLRHDMDAGIDYGQFIAGAGKFCATLQRNAILDLSGIAINNSMTLAIEGTLQTPAAREVAVFLRHLRRAVCFLESVQLET